MADYMWGTLRAIGMCSQYLGVVKFSECAIDRAKVQQKAVNVEWSEGHSELRASQSRHAQSGCKYDICSHDQSSILV